MSMRRWEWLVLLLCLALFGLNATLSAAPKSATFDEEYHITRGYAYLRTGDLRMSFSHPPLVNAWSSLPLLLLPDITLPLDHPSWAEGDLLTFADEFLWRSNENSLQMVALARLPVTVLGIVLVFVVFWWTRQLAGAAASWVALALVLFDPNLLAHSRLATNDLGLTCFLLLTIWRLWSALESPSWGNVFLTGLFAGATMAAKFSGLLVWPIILAVMLLYPGYTHRRLAALGAMGLAALVVLWVVYRFDIGLLPGTNLPIPVPAPYYLSTLWGTFADFEAIPRPAYLLGQVSERGWWYYFPAALLVKNSIPFLLLTALGIVPMLRHLGPRRSSVLWLPVLFFLGLGMTGRLSIGYRHILPVVPFLIIIAGHSVLWAGELRAPASRLVMPVIAALLLWQALAAATLFPHYEAYFNELAGGPDNGYRVLVDSNLDWGQDLPALRELVSERGLAPLYLSYFGTAPPEKYGVSYRPLPSFPRFTEGKEVQAYNPYTPPPGWYAISATSLQLGLYLEDRDLYAYFADKEPAAQAGYSINLYEVTYPEETAVVRDLVVGQAVRDVPPEQFDLSADERLVAKWSQSDSTSIDWLPHPEGTKEGATLPADFQPVGVNFGDAFTLVAFAIPQPEVSAGDNLVLTLVWQVESADIAMPRPTTADPLAAFVHVADAGDAADIVAQYDGWETALTGLEQGDVITQTVQVYVPEDTPPDSYQVNVGLYSPQSGQRLPLNGGGITAGWVTLAAVVVR